MSRSLQQFIDAAHAIAIPEYQAVCADQWKLSDRERMSREAMERACKELANAVRRRIGSKTYKHGENYARWTVSAHPLVNHADRPMTWKPCLTISAHIILWEPKRIDIDMVWKQHDSDEKDVLEWITTCKRVVDDVMTKMGN